MIAVPFLDLPAEYRSIQPAIDSALAGVLHKCDFILGSAVGAFEEEFARYCGAHFAIGVNSGLDALALTLEASGIGPGDEVITAANTFVATACAISRCGAKPVLVDCDEDTLALDVRQVAAALTLRTRAVIPVHLYGRLMDLTELQNLTHRHGLLLIEDAAQAHGAVRHGRRAGTFGQAGCFSFYPAKNLGAFGDGGCVVTDDERLAEYVRSVRTYGQKVKNRHDWPGTNSRLDTLQAAVLRAKLPHLDEWNGRRRTAAAYYRELLIDVPVLVPAVPRDTADHVYHLFVIRVARRDQVQAALHEQGIQTGVHYPTPIHLQPAYRSLHKPCGSYPVAERTAGELLSLPLFPTITRVQVETVVETLQRVLRSLGIHDPPPKEMR